MDAVTVKVKRDGKTFSGPTLAAAHAQAQAHIWAHYSDEDATCPEAYVLPAANKAPAAERPADAQ